jgi:hypothetical protein
MPVRHSLFTMNAATHCDSCGWLSCPGTCESPSIATALEDELIARLAADFIAADDCGCEGTGVVLVAEGGRWDDGAVERACECGGAL